MSRSTMTIGKLARSAGVGVETVRFYERKGLLDEPARGESGYRQYVPGTLTRLRFIRQAKELGFTLPEIQELLSLRGSPAASCSEIQERIQAKLGDIQEKIDSLERMKRALHRMAGICLSGASPISECPILDALEKETVQDA